MPSSDRLNVVLMRTDIRPGEAPGFHRIMFRIESGGRSLGLVTVQISQDAFRKLRSQIMRIASTRPNESTLLTGWAKWVLVQRIESGQPPQPLITITSSDVDDFGSYASEIRRILRAS